LDFPNVLNRTAPGADFRRLVEELRFCKEMKCKIESLI
jgi:hypothetical protein